MSHNRSRSTTTRRIDTKSPATDTQQRCRLSRDTSRQAEDQLPVVPFQTDGSTAAAAAAAAAASSRIIQNITRCPSSGGPSSASSVRRRALVALIFAWSRARLACCLPGSTTSSTPRLEIVFPVHGGLVAHSFRPKFALHVADERMLEVCGMCDTMRYLRTNTIVIGSHLHPYYYSSNWCIYCYVHCCTRMIVQKKCSRGFLGDRFSKAASGILTKEKPGNTHFIVYTVDSVVDKKHDELAVDGAGWILVWENVHSTLTSAQNGSPTPRFPY